MNLRFTIKPLLWVFTLSLISTLVVGAFLSKGKTLGLRHKPFATIDVFDFSSGRFSDYITHQKEHLRQARLDTPAESIIENASPFELIPQDSCPKTADGRHEKGIVLTHGLIASPYSMRTIADYFQSRCFYVLGILLPDHASRPGDFLHTRWQSWVQTQHFATEVLQKKASKVFLSGHSIGGELALYEAATNPNVDGLILFTPAMRIAKAARYAQYINWLGRLFPKAAWFEVRDDTSSYRYESVTFSAAQASFGLIQATNKALSRKPLDIPIFTVASAEDNTVDTPTTLNFMAKQTHPMSRTVLYSQHPQPSTEYLKVINSSDVARGILSVSHLGIMLPESHKEYGRNGLYRSCGHYFNEPETLKVCTEGKRDFYGEVTQDNLSKGIIERIAFNPFYEQLLTELDNFLDSLN